MSNIILVSWSDIVTSYTFRQGCQMVWSHQEQDSSSLRRGAVMVCETMIMLKPVKSRKCTFLSNESRKQHLIFSKLSQSFLLSSSTSTSCLFVICSNKTFKTGSMNPDILRYFIQGNGNDEVIAITPNLIVIIDKLHVRTY